MDESRTRLLDRLETGPARAETLASELDSSPTAIRGAIADLEAAGFEIERSGERFALRAIPTYGEAVAYGLDAPFTVDYHETIDSTNERGRTLAADGAADVVVLADRQTGGRGRRDRQWASPSGGVWLSVVLRPGLEPAEFPLLTLAAAISVARAAHESGVNAGIKWPNDVEVAGRKLAGILTESGATPGGERWVVVGVGVNANVDAAALPDDRPATSLAAERGTPIDRRVFTQRLLETFQAHRTEPTGVLPAWRTFATTLERRVRVRTPGGPIVGTAVDVTETGALVIRTDGGRETVTVGDCEHLRPVS